MEQLMGHDLFNLVEQLFSKVQDCCLPSKLQWKYECLDMQLVEAKTTAKWQCCKICMGQVPWCPLLAKAINCLWYWKGIIARQQGWQIGIRFYGGKQKEPVCSMILSTFYSH